MDLRTACHLKCRYVKRFGKSLYETMKRFTKSLYE